MHKSIDGAHVAEKHLKSKDKKQAYKQLSTKMLLTISSKQLSNIDKQSEEQIFKI